MSLENFIPQNQQSWLLTLYFFLVLFAVLGLSEILARFFKLPGEFSRKFIHIAVGLLVVIFSFRMISPQPLIFLSLVFSIANYFIKKYNLVPAMQSKRETYGTVYYPLAILFAIFIFWENYRFIFVNVVLIMALADAFAAVTGQALKNPLTYKVWDDIKSIQGSIVFMLITFQIIILTFMYMKPLPGSIMLYSIWLIALVISVITTVAESISIKGSDNFSITLVAGFFFFIFFYGDVFYQQQFLQALIFALLIALVSIRLHFLNIDGAVSTAFLALFIYGIGGWQWTIPVLTFFLTSSIFSKMGRRKKHHFRLLFEKSSKRDSKQVFANGGVALLIILLYFLTQDGILFYLYLVALAAANADTWATELGVYNKSNPRMITTFRKAEKGSSGAVSLVGSLAAFFGSFVIVASGFLVEGRIPFMDLILLTLCGFLATYIDSLLGATHQAQFQSGTPPLITEKATDENGQPNKMVRGYRWLNNDLVNFIAIASGPLLYLTIRAFM